MADNTVIVALPARDERVWKVSSEKKPHLTLLFLGETGKVTNLDDIMQFTEHAVTLSEHGPFMMSVDYRDTLGEDEADVLFFEKDYSSEWIDTFRHQLLQNESIRSAWESVEQFPEWHPHLTLGYPETPAKEDDSDHGIHWVSFDRIAVWTGNYEGPEFRLKWSERMSDSAVAWSAVAQEGERHILEHYGVKGMQWGVRKRESSAGKTTWDPEGHDLGMDFAKSFLLPMVLPPIGIIAAIPSQVRLVKGGARGTKAYFEKRADDKDKKFLEKKAKAASTMVEIHNGAVPTMNRRTTEINKKYPGDLTKSAAKKKKYDDEILNMMRDEYRASANSLTSKANKRHFDLDFVNGTDFKVVVKPGPATPQRIDTRDAGKIKHADGDEEPEYEFEFGGNIQRNQTGHIVGLEFNGFELKTMAHTIELGENFLEHYGVKGMKWGVRRSEFVTRQHQKALGREVKLREKRPAQEVRALATIGKSKRKKAEVRTKGGEDHPPTDDAVTVAVARQKIRRSGLQALSNHELQVVERRLNLESNVKRLTEERSPGQKFIDGLLGRNVKSNEPIETAAGKTVREAVIPGDKKKK